MGGSPRRARKPLSKEPGKSVLVPRSPYRVPLTPVPLTHAVVEMREGHLSQLNLPRLSPQTLRMWKCSSSEFPGPGELLQLF